MKKIIKFLVFVFAICLVIYGVIMDIRRVNLEKNINHDGAKYNGWLSVNGSHLINQNGKDFRLRGVSSHGIQWYGNLYSYENLRKLRDNFNINVFRISMYVNPKDDGYITNKELFEDVVKIIDYAVSLDIYVIIDWHVLDNNTLVNYGSDAVDFFDKISYLYKDVPNVIYEICNELNDQSNWDNDIKPYAESVIDIIRYNSPNSLILVGIPDWGKNLNVVRDNLLDYDNIMYSVHFYSGSDGDDLKQNISSFVDDNLPVFISECGITNSTGNGKIYDDEFIKWIDFLNNYNISWVFWSFSNKNESSSILSSDYNMDDELILDEFLSESGKIIRDIFLHY